MLAMQGLIESGRLVIAPHPLGIQSAYIVFDPAEDLMEEAFDHLKIRYPERFPIPQ